MPQTTTTITASTWTLITSNDVTAIRVQNQSDTQLYVKATVGATPPTDTTGSIRLDAGQAITADLTLAQLFPGIAGTRVYVWAPQAAAVSYSHA